MSVMNCTCILVETIETKSLNCRNTFQGFCFFVLLFHIPSSQSSCFQILHEDQPLYAHKIGLKAQVDILMIHLFLVLELEL